MEVEGIKSMDDFVNLLFSMIHSFYHVSLAKPQAYLNFLQDPLGNRVFHELS